MVQCCSVAILHKPLGPESVLEDWVLFQTDRAVIKGRTSYGNYMLAFLQGVHQSIIPLRPMPLTVT